MVVWLIIMDIFILILVIIGLIIAISLIRQDKKSNKPVCPECGWMPSANTYVWTMYCDDCGAKLIYKWWE